MCYWTCRRAAGVHHTVAIKPQRRRRVSQPGLHQHHVEAAFSHTELILSQREAGSQCDDVTV